MNLSGVKMLSDSGVYTPPHLPPRFQKLIAFLDAIPDSTVMDGYRVAAESGLKEEFVRARASTHPAIRPYRFILNRKAWWGNKRTVAKVLCPKPEKQPSKR